MVLYYSEVLWTHHMLAPKEEGIRVIAASLGCDESQIKVAKTQDVNRVIVKAELPDTLRRILPEKKGKLLLVCIVGGT